MKTTKMRVTKITGLLIFSGAILFASCKKKEEADISVMEDEIISNQSSSEFETEEMYSSLDCDFDWSTLSEASCATITESSEDFPKTITIDYGTGCTDWRGRTKSGIIMISISDDLRENGATRVVTFDNFAINNIQIVGERNVKNIGLSTGGNPLFSVNAEMTFTRNDNSRTRKVTHEREWIAGSETCAFADDEFLITGTGETTGLNDRKGTHTIITPLHIAPGTCDYIMEGSIEVAINKRRGGTIDFGSGDCDNIATLTTFKGDVHEIDLVTKKIIE